MKLTYILIIATISTLIFFSATNKASAQPLDSIVVDFQPNELLRVSSINIVGNRRTKKNTILCEMEVALGDTLTAWRLPQIISDSRINLLKTSLFNYVTITVLPQDSLFNGEIMLEVKVEERLYVWPQVNITPHHGNLNEWLKDPDLSLIDYCFGVTKYNFRGRRETISISLRRGFNNITRIGYNNIALGPKRHHLIGTTVEIAKQKLLFLETAENEAVYREFEGVKKSFTEYSYLLQYTHRPTINFTHTFTLGYLYRHVCDSVVILNPEYLGNGRTSLEGVILRYNLRLDHRSSNYYPLSGSFLALYFGKICLFDNSMNNWNIDLDFRKYLSMASRLYFATQIYASWGNKDMPFSLMQAIGYKPNILKGYEYNMIAGHSLLYINTSYKWEIVKPGIIHIKKLNLPRFNKIHYAIYLNLFANMGYVSKKTTDDINLNTMNGSMLGAGGVGLDFVTYYDRVFTAYCARNVQGNTYIGVGFKTAF